MAYRYFELGILQRRFLEVERQQCSMRKVDGQVSP
jgi:hypothetical protein